MSIETRLTKAEDAIDEAGAPSGVIVLGERAADTDGKLYLWKPGRCDADDDGPALLPAELAELERNYKHVIVVRYVDMTATTTS